MKKIITLVLLLSFLSCKSQKIKNISNNTEMNYVFARIYTKNIIDKELYNGGLFITVFQLSDSKATPKNYFKDTDTEILDSFIISVTPDGDYYTSSKLYKIEGMYNPKILEIKEMVYPKFLIKIEYGAFKKRKTKVFEFEGM